MLGCNGAHKTIPAKAAGDAVRSHRRDRIKTLFAAVHESGVWHRPKPEVLRHADSITASARASSIGGTSRPGSGAAEQHVFGGAQLAFAPCHMLSGVPKSSR